MINSKNCITEKLYYGHRILGSVNTTDNKVEFKLMSWEVILEGSHATSDLHYPALIQSLEIHIQCWFSSTDLFIFYFLSDKISCGINRRIAKSWPSGSLDPFSWLLGIYSSSRLWPPMIWNNLGHFYPFDLLCIQTLKRHNQKISQKPSCTHWIKQSRKMSLLQGFQTASQKTQDYGGNEFQVTHRLWAFMG